MSIFSSSVIDIMVSKDFATNCAIYHGTMIRMYYTFVLEFHELIKDKNKIRWIQTANLIRDPTLDFNKKIMFSLLTRNLGNTLKNLCSQRPQKPKPCSVPIRKVICGKTP